jgi:hypothetical protein
MASNQEMLRNPIAMGTALTALCIDAWGTEYMDWEPEVVGDALYELARGPVPQVNKDKISAMAVLLTRNSFIEDAQAFSFICNTLGGEDIPVLFTTFDPPMPEEVASTVMEYFLNVPLEKGEKGEEVFGPEVLSFIAVILQDAGLTTAPPPLDFVEVPSSGFDSMIADDPAMYEAVWSIQRSNADGITEYARARATLLTSQLQKITLKNGSTEDILKRLGKHFSRTKGEA